MHRATLLRAVQDAVLAACLVALGLAEVWGLLRSAQGEGSPVVSTVGVVAAGVLLSLRRVRPPWATGVVAVWLVLGVATLGHLQVLFWGAFVPMLLAVYSLARHGQGRWPWVGAGAVSLALLLGGAFLPALQGWDQVLFDWLVCVGVLAVGWGLRRSEARAVAEAVRAQTVQAASDARADEAVAQERARIARELHDVLAHSVSVMVVQAGAAAEVVEDDPALARAALESIRGVGTASLDEVRRVVAMLRDPDEPGAYGPQPGLDCLGDLVRDARAGGVDVSLDVVGDISGLPPGLELAAYRIVQEALTNVRRHTDATRTTVVVRSAADHLELEVCDNGGGRPRGRGRRHRAGSPDPARTDRPVGHGLIGMRERAALYGGSLEAAPVDEGFRVRAVLPRAAT